MIIVTLLAKALYNQSESFICNLERKLNLVVIKTTSLFQGAEEGEGDEEIIPQDQWRLQHVSELAATLYMIMQFQYLLSSLPRRWTYDEF